MRIFEVDQADSGDAPEPPYRTRLSALGAEHALTTNLFLGLGVDSDADGQPTADATGDDALDFSDDDDGVFFALPIIPGDPAAAVTVAASTRGLLDAWIDSNGDGDGLDAAEWIASNVPVLAGWNTISYSVPAGAAVPQTFARVRFTSYSAALAPTGLADDGEVEDDHIDGTPLFADDFESGGTGAWSVTVP